MWHFAKLQFAEFFFVISGFVICGFVICGPKLFCKSFRTVLSQSGAVFCRKFADLALAVNS
jgi:hypothetical protein